MENESLSNFPTWTVSRLTTYLRELFETDDLLRDVWVRGEISNLSKPRSGHIYFTLKDSDASLRSVVWRSTAARLSVDLYEGMAIEAHGYLSIYDLGGQYQLYADEIRSAGEGALYQEFLRLKDKLEREGLFDLDRKKPIPALPQKIGIVTSATGAALRDMLNTLRRRLPLVEVILSASLVQGDAAPPSIVNALDELLRNEPDLDLILLGRGGGSIEDLWAFNDEFVVRMVAASPVPIISGVGHETDFTLTDFAADLRAATPTAAAELATPITIAELRGATDHYTHLLDSKIRDVLDEYYARVDDFSVRLNYLSPRRRVQQGQQNVDMRLQRLGAAQVQRQRLMREQLSGLMRRLDALNPQAVLARGYAILTAAEDGRLVDSIGKAKKDDRIKIRVKDGEFDAKIS